MLICLFNSINVTDNEGAVSNLNYVSVDHENGLDHRLCSTVCNPIAKAIVNIIGQDLFDRWINCSTILLLMISLILLRQIFKMKRKVILKKFSTTKNLKNYFIYLQSTQIILTMMIIDI